MNAFPSIFTAICLSLAGAAAHAQSTPASGNTAPMGTANAQGVGVSAQTASAAQRQAIPRSDTATVVRTGPSATDKAADMKRSVTPSRAKAASEGGSMTSSSTTPAAAPLPPRKDRN